MNELFVDKMSCLFSNGSAIIKDMNKFKTSFLLVVILSIFITANPVSAQSSSLDTQALIKQLQEQIKALQTQVLNLSSQLEATKKETTATKEELKTTKEKVKELKEEIKISRSLRRGVKGDDVRELQEFLTQFPDIYPSGSVTGFFGSSTETAVRKLQQRYGIQALGVVGPKTISKINELLTEGAGKSGVIPPGLLTAPGIEKKLATATESVPSFYSTSTLIVAAATSSLYTTATTTAATSTVAISATQVVPATPATPATLTVTAQTTTYATTITAGGATTTATTSSPVFTITSPNGGEQWTAGNTYIITWTSVGTNASTASFDLYKAGGYSTSIAQNVSNNGSFSWTVPSTINTGNDYKIRVYNSMYYNNFDESNSAFSIIVPVTAPNTPPIGYWKFDGNGNNEIAGNPSAVAAGNATFKTSGGKFGGYLYVPTGTDSAKIPYNSMFDLPDNFTIEFWFRQRSNQSFNQNLIYKGTPVNNYNFNISRWLWNEYNQGPVIAGHTAANTGYWTQPSNPNQLAHGAWHHVAFTKSPSYHAYYLDGNLTGSKDITSTSNTEYGGPAKTPAVDIIIGDTAVDTDFDNLRIYNYALNRGEILYNWENVPGTVVTASDTIAPSVPSNLTTTTSSSTQINIFWVASTDNMGVAGYRVYRNGAQVATVAGTTYSDTGLAVATTYSYTVVAYDATGNVSAQSSSVSATTPAATTTILPAPTYIRGDWFYGWPDIRNNTMAYDLIIQYPSDNSAKASKFRLYKKNPGDSSFSLAAEFSGFDTTSCTANAGAIYVGEWYLKGPPWGSCQYWFIYRSVINASSYTVGEYNYYVAAVDAAGNEGTASPTVKFVFLQPTTITSPTAPQTTSLTPTFQWTRGSNWPSDFKTQVALFDSLSAINPSWTSSPWTTNTLETYNGSALDPAKQYRVSVFGVSAGPSSYTTSLVLPVATVDFRVSTTTSLLDPRAKNLATEGKPKSVKEELADIATAISKIAEEIKKLLKR